MNRIRDDAPPWSFFIPVTLAVIVGVLAADAIRYAVVLVFTGQDVVQPAGRAQRDAAEQAASPANGDAGTRSDPSPGGPDRDVAVDTLGEDGGAPAHRPAGSAAEAPMPSSDPAQSGDTARAPALRELPGPLSARRDEAKETCINGTVAYRSGNGWQQSLENDAPIRCTATSP